MISMMIVAAMLAADAPLVPLKPNSPWNVQFADKMCAVGRSYDAPQGKTVLIIKAPLIGEHYQIYVIRPQGQATKNEIWNQAYALKPDGIRAGPFFARAYSTVAGTRMVVFSLDPDKYRLADTADTLSFDMLQEGKASFSVVNLRKALSTLEVCTKDLRKPLGLDEAYLDQIEQMPSSIGGTAYRTEDYPSEALRKREQGEVAILAWVETSGKISSCKVMETSRTQSLDVATCSALRARGRFKPAVTKTGEKVRAPIYQRVRWELPSF